jgi:hypothetical protein
MLRRVVQRLVLLLAVAPTACSGNPEPSSAGPVGSPAPPGSSSVLFVGNSLTEANDVPSIVEALARAGGRPLIVDSVTYGGVSLEDHWNMGTAKRIESGGWRYVVLQQGPSSLAESRANLREWTKRFDAVIKAEGGTTALYAFWPEAARRNVFPDVSDSYRLAAEDVGGVFLPAGNAWLAAWSRDPSLPLYGSDQFHPSVMGSYLAALTIYGGLTGASPVGLPAKLILRTGATVEVPASQAPLLQEAAAEALANR